MMRKAEVIICPKCRAVRVNRRRKACSVCGVGLYYQGDFLLDDNGYVYSKTRDTWVPVRTVWAKLFR